MMIVDDEARIADSIYNLMDEHFELELYRCYSALDALQVIQTMRFDIVISDVSMPGMNGLELLKRTQAIWPKCHFLILTAYDSFDYAYEALQHERVDYLLKIEDYNTICDCVQKKLSSIQAERKKEEQLLHYDQHIQQIMDSSCRYFLKRIILQGIPLPEQHDVDQLHVPIRLQQPMLLALLAVNSQNSLRRNQDSLNIVKTAQARLSTHGLQCLSYSSADTILLAIFAAENNGLAGDLATYAHTALEALPQIVEDATGQQLAILCADQTVSWAQSHALYSRACIQLESIRNENGMMLFSAEEELRNSHEELSFPSVEEISMLWDMIKFGNLSGLEQVLQERLRTIVSPSALPQRTTLALNYLIMEAQRLYTVEDDEFSERLSAFSDFETMESWLQSFCDYLRKIYQNHDESREKRKAWLIIRIDQYIEQHYHKNLTLTSLAEEMHYSPAYLSRFYKANTGTNLMTYLLNVRIQKARELLLDSNDRISDIALKTGFNSTKYFNRMFKKVIGISPIQFRKENKQ
jgi:two-component system response regulator YesN